jgi:D-arabinose 1-dehydrogenase-like Zn-dependent alcohol dehydrogenase
MAASPCHNPHMRAVQVPLPNAPLERITRDIPEPGPGEVRIRVEACGICHSDVLAVSGIWPGISYPRIPGHEVAGVVNAVGGVAAWKPGTASVSAGGGQCHYCDNCRRGDFFACRNVHEITGLTRDNGYAER